VQKVREAAGRMKCSNNLKQVVLATHNYLATFNTFPHAGKGYSWCGNTATGDAKIYNANGLLLLLPYLEQSALYQQFNLNEAFASISTTLATNPGNTSGVLVGNPQTNGNAALASTVIQAFICPTDSSAAPTDRLIGGITARVETSRVQPPIMISSPVTVILAHAITGKMPVC
jgi:hypothetical protein